MFGSSTSSCWRILEALGGSRSLQNQDSLIRSVSWRLTSHDLSCLSVFGGFPECSEVTIYRAWRCLETFRMVPGRVRELHKLLLEDLGGSWGLSKFAKLRFIDQVGVWEAHNSRSVVPVSVWRLPRMLRSHDLSCLSVFGGLPGGVWSPPGWLLHVFGSSTSSSWISLESLGGSRM